MESIDKAMRTFGMPVGPIELLDDVGIDVAAKAGGTMAAAFPARMPADPTLEKLVDGRATRAEGEEGILFLRKGKTRRPGHRRLRRARPLFTFQESEYLVLRDRTDG